MNTQNNQNFGSQSWQGKFFFSNIRIIFFCLSGLQTIQNQPQFPGIIFFSSNLKV